MSELGNKYRHMNWQPIGTAPRDRPVLIYTYRPEAKIKPPEGAPCCYVMASWTRHGWCCYHAQTFYMNPTHWCELEMPER